MPRGERSLTTQVAVTESYYRTRPTTKAAFAQWVEQTAVDLGISETTVLRYGREEETARMRQLQGAVESASQTIANTVGATLVRALDTLSEGLEAGKSRPMKDSHGNIQKDGKGEVMLHIEPDWPTRTKCAELIVKIHAGFAPEQLDINQHVIYANKTDAELLKRFDELNRNIARIRESGADGSGSGTARKGIAGPKGNSGSVVLANGMHPDEGRTGDVRRSVQAVPKTGISQANA